MGRCLVCFILMKIVELVEGYLERSGTVSQQGSFKNSSRELLPILCLRIELLNLGGRSGVEE